MNSKGGKSNDEIAKEFGLMGLFVVIAAIGLPLLIVSLFATMLALIIKSVKIRGLIIGVSLLIFILTMISDFNSYFAYLPIFADVFNAGFMNGIIENLFDKKPQVTLMTYIQYISGGIVIGTVFSYYRDYLQHKTVNSKKVAKDKFYNSSQFKRIRKKRDKINDKIQKKFRQEKPVGKVLLGINEKGEKLIQDFKELNSHLFLTATTGGGKTVALLNYVEYVAMFNKPMLFIDGKGSTSTIDDVAKISNAYGKELKVFGDRSNVTYNPIKHGNATQITDKLAELVQTESTYYSSVNVALIQPLISFLDDYKIERNLHNLAKYLDPEEIKKVLDSDVEIIEEEYEEVEKVEDENKEENKSSGFDITAIAKKDNPNTENTKTVIKTRKKEVKSDKAQIYQEKFFDRYKHTREGETFLFANADTVRIVIYKLIDSDIGHLFVESDNELDLVECSENKEHVFVSFDGQTYGDFIKVIGRFLILDINYLSSKRVHKEVDTDEYLAIFDEFSVYANEKVVDTINKSREGNFHIAIATQSISDLHAVDPNLANLVIQNTNTHIIGKTNSPEDVDLWSKAFGTYDDYDVTYKTGKSGRSFLTNRVDEKDSAGTVRKVNHFNIEPDRLRDLGVGEFAINRKSSSKPVKPTILYCRYPLNIESEV